MEQALRDLIAQVQNPHLRTLLDRVLGPEAPTWPAFRDAPAAKRYHQAYRHGLLEHSLSVGEAVAVISTTFPHIDRDVAITGALLHDIGKLDAYTSDPLAIDLTDLGKLHGEIALGYYRIRSEIEAHPRTSPRELAAAVLHIILSHHGQLEHGSPVVPCTREATLVHMIDNLGGKLGSFDRLEKALPQRLGLVGVRPGARRRRLLRRPPGGVDRRQCEGDGRLDRARARALAARPRRPSAPRRRRPPSQEGLSWAAWWLDDGPTVFAARERAFTLYRDGGDALGAARMALWLAVDELDFRSSWAVANGWLQRAERLLEGIEPAPEHGWLAFHEGYIAHASGDTARAGELARTATELGRRLGVPDLEMLGLALEGATLVACARVDEGMRRLDEATATALEGGAANPMSGAWTFCFLVSACTAVLDYGRAAQWCDRIAEFAERYGSRMMLGYCRAEYGAVYLWRGRWGDAEAMLEAAIEDFMQSRPGMVGGPLAGLAELRRRQGRPADAARLCEQAEGSSSGQLCLARMALDRGEPAGGRRAGRAAAAQRARASPAVASAGARAARAGARRRRRPRRRRRRAGRPCARSSARWGPTRCGRAPTSPRARWRPPAASTTAPACCSRTPSTPSRAAARRSRPHRRGSRWPTASPRSAAATPPNARPRRRASVCASLAAPAAAAAPELTPREREVLALLAEGLTNRQVAERLVLSEHTVHRHVTSILRKLDLPSRTAAAAVAIRSGL